MASLLSSQSLQLDIAVFCVKVLIICFQKHLKNTKLNFKTMKWFKTEKAIMLKKKYTYYRDYSNPFLQAQL